MSNMIGNLKKRKTMGKKKPSEKGPASPKSTSSIGPNSGTGKPTGPPKDGPPQKNEPRPQKKSSWGSFGSKLASFGKSMKGRWGKKPAVAAKPAAAPTVP